MTEQEDHQKPFDGEIRVVVTNTYRKDWLGRKKIAMVAHHYEQYSNGYWRDPVVYFLPDQYI